jgi:hypothetical protein
MGTEPAANADAKPYVAPTEVSSSEDAGQSPTKEAPSSEDSSAQGQVASSSEPLILLQLLWVILPILL